MRNSTITFQMPTHFLPRVGLRLEYLYSTLQDACRETHPAIHHHALLDLVEILKIIEKPELKSRFLKELMRFEHLLERGNPPPAINGDRLYQQIMLLSHVCGRFGEGILDSPFLQSVRVSQHAQGNECALPEPQLLLWLDGNADQRRQDFEKWTQQLHNLWKTVEVYLAILRDNSPFSPIDLHTGFYQRPLPGKPACQLILLRMDKNSCLVPKMQLGHHGLSLRLLDATTLREVHQKPTVVELAVCQL